MVVGLAQLDEPLDGLAIAEADGRTGGEHHQLTDQVAADLGFILQQQPLELPDVLKRPSVLELTARVHLRGIVELIRPAVLAEALFRLHVGCRAAVALAPPAEHVEVLQREARGINFPVAGRAAFICAVLFQLVADGHGSPDVGFDRGHRGRRRGHGVADDSLHDPLASHDRRGGCSVGRYL